MHLTAFIARRYLFSKKSHNAINIISGIAVGGIALATMAMVCTLGVLSGFRDLIGTLYTAFDPELVVVPTRGKFAAADDPALDAVRRHPDVASTSATLQENALILFRGHPLVVTIKGVDNAYARTTGIEQILISGEKNTRPRLTLSAAEVEYGILGQGLARQIGSINFGSLQICAPKGGERINIANPIESFNVADLQSCGIAFSVNQRKYDDFFILTSLPFATGLFEKEGQLSRLEVRLRPESDPDAVKDELRTKVGAGFQVLDRMEQQADVFNVMQLEKLMAYIFLTFILIIASFNLLSSLSMLIIEKRRDVETLRHLGLPLRRIRHIFMTEGALISLIGAVIGLSLGLILCLLQQEYGFLRMGNGQNFIIRSYPVSVHLTDLALVFATVLLVGLLSVWYPTRALSRRLLT